MKKTLLFSLLALFTLIVSCKKDNDETPTAASIAGTWQVTYDQTLFQYADGTPFREYGITEDDEDTSPDYNLTITNTTISSSGEDGSGETYTYTLSTMDSKNYINLDSGNGIVTYEYTIAGNEMTWRSEQVNYVVEGASETAVIPKYILVLKMIKQ
jgi:hypothetical protein